MALTPGQIGTRLFFVSLAFFPLVSSELCSVFVLNLDDPETYSRRNVNCTHQGVQNDICCSGTCCQLENNQLFRIENVDGIFKVEKSQSNLEDLVEIARRGKTIVFKKVKRLQEFAETESQYWLTVIIVVPCSAILVIIICIILCCCCCPCCPCARKKSGGSSNQTNQAAQVVQIPMQYLPNPQQQTHPQVYPYPRPQVYPDTLPQGYQPHSQQQGYPNPPLQQAYPNPPPQQAYPNPPPQQAYPNPPPQQAYLNPPPQQANLNPPQQQAYPNSSQQQAYQRSPQPSIYLDPQQDNLPPERGRINSVGFQPISPKPQPGEPSRKDTPSAPLPT